MSTFIPGEFWTPQRARDAVERMTNSMALPQTQALMAEFAAATAAGDPAAALVEQRNAYAGIDRHAGSAPIDRVTCLYRRGTLSDVAEIARLLVFADLSPLFIEEFVGGFVVVEHAGDLVGCGGLEIYDRAAVIRSVVVDKRLRGQGVGVEISQLLIEDARHAGAGDLYLLTGHADDFWRRLGFIDARLDNWKHSARAYWPYRFIAHDSRLATQVRSMSRRLT